MIKHNRYLLLVVAILSLILCNCQKSELKKGLPLIIDADTANEVDDLFAIVRAIVEPSIDLLGITSAQFHISPLASDTTVLESQKMNEDIIRLMNRSDIPLPVGSNKPLSSSSIPQVSEASDFIIMQAHNHSEEDPLHLVILGSCTNVASAVIQDPTIIPKINVHYLGFWHDIESNVYDKKEFNSGNDTLAVNVLLDLEDLQLDVMTATTSQHLVFKKSIVNDHLKGKGGISDYLVDRWNTYERWWTKEDPEKLEWIMWDVAIIEALIHPGLTTKEAFVSPPENTQRYIQVYTEIDVEAMEEDFWKSLSKIE